MAQIYNPIFTAATIDSKRITFVAWCTNSREYVKAFDMDSYESAKAYAGGGGYNRRGVAASKALKELTGVDRDENFFDKLSWRVIF